MLYLYLSTIFTLHQYVIPPTSSTFQFAQLLLLGSCQKLTRRIRMRPSQSFYIILVKLSKPKLNPQLNSTVFEVRLHSYPIIHPTTHPHKLNLYTQNWEELTAAQLARRDPLYKCTVTYRPVQPFCTTFSRPNFNFFQTKGF